MIIRIPLKNIANVQLMRQRLVNQRRKTSYQKGEITKLKNQVAELNHLVKDDILALTERQATYKGNAYTTYKDAVEAINSKYNGTADWGVLQTGNIIDLRSAFTIGEGPKVVKKAGIEEAEAEIRWVNNFFEYNDIDKEVAQELAKEAEIEGKLAIKLAVEEVKDAKEDEQKFEITARYVSWTETSYKVKTDPQDYMRYKTMTWRPTDKQNDETLKEPNFVYKKFGGRMNKPNTPAPKVMKCLTQIESLDKALRDWREINNIFAAPILNVECDGIAGVTSANEALDNKNWKLRKIFISTNKLSYAQFDIKGVESLENEIITLSKMISGTTGIPVHFLGLPDLMSNRSTAENLMELILAGTTYARQTWIGAYEEMIAKGMALYNDAAHQGVKLKRLDHRKIGIEIPMITREHWENLTEFYLPASIAGKISDEALLEQVPGLDLDKEKERKEEREASEFERIKQENKDLKDGQFDKGIFKKEDKEKL